MTATTTTNLAIAATGLSILPHVNGDALFGAVIGAAFMALYTHNINHVRKFVSFFISAAIGYLLAPEMVKWTFLDSHATSAFIIAIVAIPILLKISVWVENATLSDILSTFKRGK